MVDLVDSRPLSEVVQNTGELVARLEESGEPEVLTVDGRAELVVQSAAACQKLLDRLDEAETIRILRERIAVADRGQTGIPLTEAFAMIRRNVGLPERSR